MKNPFNLKNKYFLLLLVILSISFAFAATPNPGHPAEQIGSGTFFGTVTDVWSFPGKVNGLDFCTTAGKCLSSSSSASSSSSPLKIEVANNDFARQIFSTFTNAGSTHNWIIRTAFGGGGGFRLYETDETDPNLRLIIANGGNVGIGTAAPGVKLHVVGGWILAQGTGSGADPATRIGVLDSDNSGGIQGWWFSQNQDGKFAIHQGNVGDRINIDGNGNVGIGTTTPTAKLHVAGDLKVDGTITSSGGGSQWTTSGANIYYNTGNVGIGTATPQQKLDVAGSIQATSFLYSSDERKKENISKINDALLKIENLKGVSFNFIGNNKTQLGFIAQEVEKVFPETVVTDSRGYKSVQYGNLIAPTVEAVKELSAQNKKQDQEILALKEEIKNLKKEIESMKNEA